MIRRAKGRRNFGIISCKDCKRKFEKRRKNQEFCNDKCRAHYHNNKEK